MSKQTLQDSIDIVNRDMQNAENEVKAVNAAAEYITLTEEKGEEKLNNAEIAEELNREYKTDLKENDIEKIEKVVDAEKNGDIESVGWDKQDNNVDMQKINEIYENNKDIFKEENNNMQTENSLQQENKTEKNEADEEKEGFLNKAKEAISNKFEELQEAAQDVDLHAALRNSDNVFDQAQAEFFDRIDEFTQNLHNQKNEQATQDNNEEKYVEIPLKNNEKEAENNNASSNFKENENKNVNEEIKDNNKDLQQDNKNENNVQTENSLQQRENENNNENNKNNISEQAKNENTNEQNEGISKETQEKLEQKAEQAQEKQELTEKSAQKAEKEAEIEASH